LGQTSGQGLDPCAALIATFQIAAGKEKKLSFDVGYASTADDALALAIRASKTANSVTRLKVENQWASLTGAVKIRTPDPLFDAMVNHWLIYQTVSCRLWAKAGFYQAGGATGFRDQLQDTMALVWAAPKMLRSQILLCASRQFLAGDVQHWWHDPAGVGVRTHFSDDLLWLPYATLHYLKATDDQALLDETVAFLNGAEIPAGSEDAYYAPTQAQEEASLYEHAALTLDRSMAVGVHGLPLMGSGDWNDGMNQVGVGGRGESVWLGWFLCSIVKGFAPLARDRHEADRASRWESAAQGWQTALVTEGWDGQWFKRAFFDNGQPMGSHINEECQIDLIAQAWSVLSNAAPQSMQVTALDSMHRMLVDPQQGLLLLLTPPFEFSDPSPGYIQTYPAGIRENGGQYTHAGVWALMAQTQAHRLGLPPAESAESDQQQTRGDLAFSYFTYLSSAHRAAHPVWGQRYGLEPYAIAGDVYSKEPYAGLGGWSWYTGAAGWLHQAAISAIFGLELKAHSLSFNPCMPSCWNETSITLKRSDISLHFRIYRNPAKEPQIVLNAGELRLEVGEELAWESLADNSRYAIALKEVCRQV
jgi:cyclic beta-1,2-glucan synthetase